MRRRTQYGKELRRQGTTEEEGVWKKSLRDRTEKALEGYVNAGRKKRCCRMQQGRDRWNETSQEDNSRACQKKVL